MCTIVIRCSSATSLIRISLIKIHKGVFFWTSKVSFGLLKTVDFAEKNLSYQKNGNSENGRFSRIRRKKWQKNTHSENGRDYRDPRTKCQTNTHSENGRVGRLRREESQKNENSERERELE